MPTKDTKNDLERALAWAEKIRISEVGHSENEKKMILLADEVLRLRRELKQKKR